MIVLNTLNTIIDDIMQEIRNENVAESETLSRIQIEQWITHYRSVLLKQDIDKGRQINPDYIQQINDISVLGKDSSGKSYSKGEDWVGRTTIKLPNTIDFHFDDGIVSITDEFDNLIQLSSEHRARRQKSRRYTKNDTVAYKKNGYLEFVGDNGISKVTVRGIFEDPMDDSLGLSVDERYPIPANMIPTLKELIMTKEINIVALTDTSNDSDNDLAKTSLTALDYKKLARGIK